MCKFALYETLLHKSLPVFLASYMLAGEEDVPLRGSSTFLKKTITSVLGNAFYMCGKMIVCSCITLKSACY